MTHKGKILLFLAVAASIALAFFILTSEATPQTRFIQRIALPGDCRNS